MTKENYLDYNASTPIAPEAVEEEGHAPLPDAALRQSVQPALGRREPTTLVSGSTFEFR